MVLRRLPQVRALPQVLEEPDPKTQRLRGLLFEGGRLSCRRTFRRRLRALPQSLPAQIGCLGLYLVALLRPYIVGFK